LKAGFFVSLQSVLFDIDDLHSFSDLSTFAQHIPVEWVASALDLSTSATIRAPALARGSGAVAGTGHGAVSQ
jgi:hypothetical protein